MNERTFVGGPDHVEEYRPIPLVWNRTNAAYEEEFITLPDIEDGSFYEVTPLAMKQLLTEAGYAPYPEFLT